jgi:hypothetical protein
MSIIKYAIDSPVTRPWAARVGQLIINFSSLEFETYLWLVQMSEKPERIPEFAKLKFTRRVELIRAFVEDRAHNPDWKADSFAAWAESLQLAKLRNRIAHNPLMFAWSDGAERGEPDYIGVAEIQGIEPPKDGILLSKAAIEHSTSEVVAIIKRLEALRKNWCQHRDSSMTCQ